MICCFMQPDACRHAEPAKSSQMTKQRLQCHHDDAIGQVWSLTVSMDGEDSMIENNALPVQPETAPRPEEAPGGLDQNGTRSDALDKLVLSRQHYYDLGPQASWTVSSSKPNYAISAVQDESLDTFWQSDGPQPHFINIHFPRLVSFKYLSIYMNYTMDESYTPSSIRIMSGMGYHTLLEVQISDFAEPRGWHHIDLTQQLGPPPPRSDSDSENGQDFTERGLETRLVQLQILANHQNGKDTHIRAIRLHAPQARAVTVEDSCPFESDMFKEDDLLR